MSPVESTKSKILEVALELFSSKGFAATSIRDIANAAEVNVSAVNYHFGSKENLNSAVIVNSKHLLKQHIDTLYRSQENWNATDFVERITDLFYELRVKINATFKVVLSDVKVDEKTLLSDDNPKGPLGTEYLLEVLMNSHQIDEEKAYKIAYITMTHIIHKTAFLYACDQKGLCLPDGHSSWEYSKEINLFLIETLTK